MVNGPLDDGAVLQFAEGLSFPDGTRCQPAHLQIVRCTPYESQAIVTLAEGKFHQVKKMFLTVGVKVTALKRTRFADFNLPPELAPGAYRTLTAQEREIILQYMNKA